ncbi:hypothetical protein I302_107153 [Kwoniella bestiolae CBS 10118]|uniref:Uncharacterized protein n=1 Tax=Kwoniella bestiolae CBS 10118 TaxID=1296100 RepID=A0A1B9FZC5_9TREE|nr:hypothetical protein I302_05580 [Kwoniella bestiolae CBS 10118]OCF24122.1 hypothetical protein I302_05580 [Kwoniella bestiolae CBS 10118]
MYLENSITHIGPPSPTYSRTSPLDWDIYHSPEYQPLSISVSRTPEPKSKSTTYDSLNTATQTQPTFYKGISSYNHTVPRTSKLDWDIYHKYHNPTTQYTVYRDFSALYAHEKVVHEIKENRKPSEIVGHNRVRGRYKLVVNQIKKSGRKGRRYMVDSSGVLRRKANLMDRVKEFVRDRYCPDNLPERVREVRYGHYVLNT